MPPANVDREGDIAEEFAGVTDIGTHEHRLRVLAARSSPGFSNLVAGPVAGQIDGIVPGQRLRELQVVRRQIAIGIHGHGIGARRHRRQGLLEQPLATAGILVAPGNLELRRTQFPNGR